MNTTEEIPLHILEKERPEAYKKLFEDESPITSLYETFIMEENVNIELIADVFPKNKLTLLHGIQGSGKSYSCIKALNEADIKPLYIAVEDTQGLANLKKDYLSPKILNYMMNLQPLDIENKVVIIDTYSRLHQGLMKVYKNEEEIPELLEKMIEFYNITIIVIGHTASFVSKDGIFRDNVSLARFASEELFLEKSEYKATGKGKDRKPARIEYNLHVNKGRGNLGARIIPNWCR